MSLQKYLTEFKDIAYEWFKESSFIKQNYNFFSEFIKITNLQKAEWADFQALGEPCITSLFEGLIVGGYSQMIKTVIISLNVWVILLPRRKPFVSHGQSSPIMPYVGLHITCSLDRSWQRRRRNDTKINPAVSR